MDEISDVEERAEQVLKLSLAHVTEQCWFVVWAYEWMQTALRHGEERRFWFGVQNLLTASANISKALWGMNRTQRDQRAPLREIIGVDDNSPLHNRDMRDHFEHLDKRFHEWARQSPTGNMVIGGILPIAPSAYVGGAGASHATTWFRTFTRATHELRFWSTILNIRDLVDEVKRVGVKAEEAAPDR